MLVNGQRVMKGEMENFVGPHQGQPLLADGAQPEQARAAMVLVHGRGATAESILTLAGEFDHPDFRYLAPQAAGNSWYPNSFLAPLEMNEPGLSSGLQAIKDALAQLEADGITAERTMLLGFSQGACLALEYAFRHPRRYGGVVALSGALITPPDLAETSTRVSDEAHDGAFAGTPVFLGCGEADSHIPLARLKPSAELLRRLGCDVTLRIYPDLPHTINHDEIGYVQMMQQTLLQ